MDVHRDIYTVKTILAHYSNNHYVKTVSDNLTNRLIIIADECHKFDYNKIKANGYRSFIYIIANVFQRCLEEKRDAQFFILVLKWVDWMADWMATWVVEQSAGGEFLSAESFLDQYYEEVRPQIRPIFADLINSFYTRSSNIMRYFGFIVAANELPWSKLARFLRDKKFRNETVYDSVTTLTPVMAKVLMKPLETKMFYFMNGLYMKCIFSDVKVLEFYVRTKPSFELKVHVRDEQLNVAIERAAAKVTSVRCKYYTSKCSPTSRNTLIMFVHGGGYVITRPEHVEIYTLRFMRHLNTAGMLSVDYTLAPAATVTQMLNELFAVYTWLTHDQDGVRNKIGFVPERIVLFGESAGASLIAGLLNMIGDLRAQYPDANVPLPHAMYCAYGPFTVVPLLYPSVVIATLDAFLSGNLLVGFTYAVCPKFSDNGQLNEKLVTEYKAHPYHTPLKYKHFDRLQDVKVFLLTSSCCPMLDYTLQYARMWTQPIEVHIADRQPHNFFLLVASSSARRETRIAIDKMQALIK